MNRKEAEKKTGLTGHSTLYKGEPFGEWTEACVLFGQEGTPKMSLQRTTLQGTPLSSAHTGKCWDLCFMTRQEQSGPGDREEERADRTAR